MKIEETLNNRPSFSGISVIETKKETEKGSKVFQSKLAKIEYENYMDELNHLAQRIFEQGNILEKRMDIKEFVVYKRFISEFLNEYVNNSHKFSKQSTMDRRGRYKVFSVVKKVNLELDILAEELLNNQKDNLKVLKSIDYIRGLILDLQI